MKRIFSCYTQFHSFGGAQKILMYIHNALRSKEYQPQVVGFTDRLQLHNQYAIQPHDYQKFSLRWLAGLSRHDIIISHHRKLTTLLVPFSKIMGFHLIHVAHNIFESHKHLSLFPAHNIAVSNSVKTNLVDYFGVPETNIQVIYNGIPDQCAQLINLPIEKSGEIVVFYPARVCSVKSQIEIVQQLQGKLDPRLKIVFSGHGAEYNRLISVCAHLPNFKVIPHTPDIETWYRKSHFVLLFSKKEGLGITLIEAAMYGKPVISNGIGGSIETFLPEKSGFLCQDYAQLIQCLNALPALSDQRYAAMCQQSRLLYENQFVLDIMLNHYLNYFQRCL